MNQLKTSGGAGLAIEHLPVRAAVDSLELEGTLSVPTAARGVVVFAHGSGSSRHSPRNRYVADILNESGLATLLIDLLSEDEQQVDLQTAHLRFDIPLLARRLEGVGQWVAVHPEVRGLELGYFGASTGAAAALVAAAEFPERVRAIVSRGGRPDLAGLSLAAVEAPTLLIVGGADSTVIELNRRAMAYLQCEKQLQIIPCATHLFPEPGALKKVAAMARDWFVEKLG
ncbi:MAG TPA: dienelactone hydrolase family protein [Bryobacteraceae bacterium]|nr:dienelactone hydrolase family protein [Bryobacteraceae bacterium]